LAPDETSRAAFFSGDEGRTGVLARLDPDNVPAHIAIIMDGNGRWAAGRGLPRLAGHRAGAKAVREVIAASLELGVGYLTIYSFSSENWNRPADEVSGLMDLFVEVLERELDNLQKMNVCVLVAGRRSDLPTKTEAAFARTEQATSSNTAMTLVVALNYGARAEIVDAVRGIAHAVADGHLDPDEIGEETISRHLYTPDVPDPDLVIRTSGEMRVSNFLLWQIAYSEFWVTDTLWPDFDRFDLLDAVLEFQGRSRRFGGR
jgi:undecaprenyl diphosphate synthase